jgi:hypothetical protein
VPLAASHRWKTKKTYNNVSGKPETFFM